MSCAMMFVVKSVKRCQGQFKIINLELLEPFQCFQSAFNKKRKDRFSYNLLRLIDLLRLINILENTRLQVVATANTCHVPDKIN